MIDRRTFLRRLGFGTVAAAAAATGVLDVERLLWTPGEKTIFLPTLEETLALNTFVTPEWVTMETLRMFKKSLRVSSQFSGPFNPSFSGTCIGSNIVVRSPRRFGVELD